MQLTETQGYVDKSNFIRKFKSIEGITPMNYRSISAQNND
jgi:AraC-like DNA-binding protein